MRVSSALFIVSKKTEKRQEQTKTQPPAILPLLSGADRRASLAVQDLGVCSFV